MNVKRASKTAEEATVEKDTETKTVRAPRMALVGVKKGALAAKQAVSKIASAPSRMFDSAVYGACYGISYGAVFSALMVVKMMPPNGLAIKGFHDGAEVARKDVKAHEEKHDAAAENTVLESTVLES
jgi:hypothetical protein